MEEIQEQEDLGELIRVRREKLKNFSEAGKNPYAITKFDVENYSADILANAENMVDKTVVIAGRLISKRIMGKASFAHLLDSKGQIQIYVKSIPWVPRLMTIGKIRHRRYYRRKG